MATGRELPLVMCPNHGQLGNYGTYIHTLDFSCACTTQNWRSLGEPVLVP